MKLVFFGPPASGKTTTCRDLADHLGQQGRKVTVVDMEAFFKKASDHNYSDQRPGVVNVFDKIHDGDGIILIGAGALQPTDLKNCVKILLLPSYRLYVQRVLERDGSAAIKKSTEIWMAFASQIEEYDHISDGEGLEDLLKIFDSHEPETVNRDAPDGETKITEQEVSKEETLDHEQSSTIASFVPSGKQLTSKTIVRQPVVIHVGNTTRIFDRGLELTEQPTNALHLRPVTDTVVTLIQDDFTIYARKEGVEADNYAIGIQNRRTTHDEFEDESGYWEVINHDTGQETDVLGQGL